MTLTVIIMLAIVQTMACTSVIVSGRVTKDGRPLLLKNRDTYDVNNHVVQMKGEKYTFLAVTSDMDKNVMNIWQGHNEKGFAIINTAAYNKNDKNHMDDDNDGHIMRLALGICSSAKDFEVMLDTMLQAGHLRANSNFGVIDAQGAAAYYETGDKGYKKFDANDISQAPYGYLVRTNFAFSGDRTMDKGIERYLAIADFMQTAAYTGHLDAEYLIRTIPRYLKHGLTHVNLYDQEPGSGDTPDIVSFEDYIPRYLTASATLIQGVKTGEDPLHTVSYTIVGNPMTTVAIPLLISDHLPSVVLAEGEGNHSWLCQKGIEMKQILFPDQHGHVTDYIDLSKLINKKGTGTLQWMEPVETEIFTKGNVVLQEIRSDNKTAYKDLAVYYKWVDDLIRSKWQR